MKSWIIIGLLGLVAVGMTAYILLFTHPNTRSQDVGSNKKSKIAGHEQHDTTKYNVFDVDFARKMIVLSQQALEINTIAELQSQDTDIRDFAKELSIEQTKTMNGYIEVLKSKNETYNNLSDFPQSDGHDMYPSYPGLASLRSLNAFREMRGKDVDKEYIRLMLEHHNGTIDTMTTASKQIQYEKIIKLHGDSEKIYTTNLSKVKDLKDKKGL